MWKLLNYLYERVRVLSRTSTTHSVANQNVCCITLLGWCMFWRMELSRLPLPLSHQLESISVLFLRCHDYRALPLLDVKVNSFGAKLYTLLCFPSGQHWKWNEGILSITDWLNIWWWMCYDITRCINSVQIYRKNNWYIFSNSIQNSHTWINGHGCECFD